MNDPNTLVVVNFACILKYSVAHRDGTNHKYPLHFRQTFPYKEPAPSLVYPGLAKPFAGLDRVGQEVSRQKR